MKAAAFARAGLFAICCVGAAGLFSCVSFAETAAVEEGSGAGEGAQSLQERETARDGVGGEAFDSPAWRGLPAEAEDYLTILAEAFSRRDRDFLISQGEARYEAENRSRYDEETYLAMLYRIGAYNEDSPFREIGLPRLSYTEIRGIQYTAWKEEGPVINVDARLIPLKGETIHCQIMLLWRLREPKILGIYP
jgi:hypothetical protein